MRELVSHLIAVAVAALAALAHAASPAVSPPQGFVTDRADVIDPATREKLTRLLEELQQKTGAEIAVLTVDTTAPLDDFTYAMQVA
ncbi:MAG TPA: TPM domain-containing protein, partial [Caldimonas sp.]|nr:TPM domain-containing protein [Caldimonas sp.]